MMKDVKSSCMQKVMISSELFRKKECSFQLKTFSGGKTSATQYHAISLTKTIQFIVKSLREGRLENR